ncbi:MAG: hypothetical protein A2431_03580 [Candidatus Zambryskibacteria bacterium RIFOXYC1_FULL_39_10]|uniref:DUF8128 domain-containing protein n=1 Tax=Candidatus Zambryskibacteria bacterium RIFOXYC1_FULL_39_10 TaxID=1802779 RepID=A0A1G2UYH4_9BACT|nr:MAG: hypothetical protein A2431_03580 [Candidatus Zambryskibacteria bacterium RIFOXYC1_FULL_39_10]OHB16799.1 MAG: hypothetical protein A2605_01270 [Candidatus Zambryskibacteria bacterium RIFOXYD1_FULL_39_35]
MLSGFLSPEIWSALVSAFKYIYLAMPIWLPIAFLVALFNAWLRYVRSKFWQKEGSVLLEIKLPKEITKSPLAMEVVLGALHQPGGEGTWIERIWKGQTRSWFSLEIASFGGSVRFFIWTKPKHRNALEAQIYSQYPGVEIYEAEDYTKPFYYNPELNNMWGCEFILTKADPFPIKTYVDYGLDKDPKEEFKIDPITPMIEFLGSLTAGHNAWIQIIVRAHKKRRILDVFDEKEDSWEDEMKKEKDAIIEKLKVAKEEGGFPRIPSKGESDMIAALERSVSKLPFDVGIRSIYIADKDKYNSGNQGGILGFMKQYGSQNLNGFKPKGWFSDFDYPWDEWFHSKESLKIKILEEYKLRRYFYSPWRAKKFHGNKSFVLNAEELATIFHFPGSIASTPTFERVPSKKSEAPANLPI